MLCSNRPKVSISVDELSDRDKDVQRVVGNTRLTASGIALWYAFMFMAYCSGWPTEVTIPVSALCLRSKLSRSAVYKERNVLRNYGLIDFDTASGRRSTRYRIRSFEARLVATEMSATRTQTETGVIIPAEDTSEMSTVVSTSRTQTGDERIKAGETSTTWPQPCIQTEDSTYISIKNKYRDKRGYGGKKRASVKHRDAFDFTFIAEPRWLELVKTWLDYKRSRGENYKSELSIKKFHTMLLTSRAAIPTSRPESSTRASPTIGRAFSNFQNPTLRLSEEKRQTLYLGVVVAIRPPDSGSDRSNNRWMRSDADACSKTSAARR